MLGSFFGWFMVPYGFVHLSLEMIAIGSFGVKFFTDDNTKPVKRELCLLCPDCKKRCSGGKTFFRKVLDLVLLETESFLNHVFVIHSRAFCLLHDVLRGLFDLLLTAFVSEIHGFCCAFFSSVLPACEVSFK